MMFQLHSSLIQSLHRQNELKVLGVDLVINLFESLIKARFFAGHEMKMFKAQHLKPFDEILISQNSEK